MAPPHPTIGRVFDESSLPELIRILERRQASLWHACGLIDFAAYLRLGGIASRAQLERGGLTVTSNASDSQDRANGRWERIFFSLNDIGHGFAAGRSMTPNVRGPIVLQVAPSALTDADNAAFSLREPSSQSSDLITDLLADGDADAVDDLFLHPHDADFPRSAFVRDDGQSLEVLVTPRRQLIDLHHVAVVWVDPVIATDAQLIDVVSGLSDELGVPLRIRRRTLLDPERAEIWHDIVRLLSNGAAPLTGFVHRADASPAFREWAQALHASGSDRLWDRFAQYLAEGTLRYLLTADRTPQPHLKAAQPDGGFWSAQRRAQAVTLDAARPAASTVRACGHPARSWDNGTCYVCVARSRSRWRYDR